METHRIKEKKMPANIKEFLGYKPETSIYDQSAAYFSVGFPDTELPMLVNFRLKRLQEHK